MNGMAIYHSPADTAAEERLASTFARLTGGEVTESATLSVQGREITVPRSAAGVAWFRFAELCETSMGVADYLEIARNYHTVMLSGIPVLAPERRNEARRLVNLVDALYEHRVNLVCTADAPAEEIYREGDHMDEFKRTASRLAEMGSRDYLSQPHVG
jgi:cell division protein ZapE